MFLVDFEGEVESQRVLTEHPVELLKDILRQASGSRGLLVRIERVPVRSDSGRMGVRV
jgi:hypothetical protein